MPAQPGTSMRAPSSLRSTRWWGTVNALTAPSGYSAQSSSTPRPPDLVASPGIMLAPVLTRSPSCRCLHTCPRTRIRRSAALSCDEVPSALTPPPAANHLAVDEDLIVVDKIPKRERDRVSRDLLDYCCRDALGDDRVGRDFGLPGPSCSMIQPTRANKSNGYLLGSYRIAT